MNTMTYQGYTAKIELDDRDNIFVGRILGIRSIISFHGRSVADLRKEFKLAINDYLEDCRENGLSPEKPASGKLLLRVPPEVHSKAMIAAYSTGPDPGKSEQWFFAAAKCTRFFPFSLNVGTP